MQGDFPCKKGDPMICRINPPLGEEEWIFVVVLSYENGKLLLSRKKGKTTWETQGGHIEPGESAGQAAQRELWEESGTMRATLTPLFSYWAGEENGSGASGGVFLAEIEERGDLPPAFEMEEVCAFSSLPENLSYPAITPILFQEAKRRGYFRKVEGWLPARK